MKRLVFVLALLTGLSLAMFDGQPVAPQNFRDHGDYANWDVIVHTRDNYAWQNLDSMMAEHGPGCEGPPATHENHSYEGAVFVCNNHLMTSINAAGYGLIYLTPSQMLDWSNGPATLTFDVSTHSSSTRDWWDLWLQDFDSNVAEPLEASIPDLQANDNHNLSSGHQYMHLDTQGNTNGFPYARSNGAAIAGWNTNLQWTANSATQRDTYQLTINATTFSFCKLTGEPTPICWANNLTHNLTTTKMTVQLGHHSYNPRKDGAGVENTWHWDNVNLSPSQPFVLIKGSTGQASGKVTGSGGVVTFNAPAPVQAFLRFAAVGPVTLDNQPVSPLKPTVHQESANNYFVPIPAGTTQVNIGLSSGWWGPSMAEGFSVWSKGSVPLTPTTTPVPATATSVATATSTSTAFPSTPTPALPSTPAPLPTATLVPQRQVCTLRWGSGTLENYGSMTAAECAARGN